MQKYVIALYIRLSIEDYKYDSLSIENQSLVLHEYAASMPEALNAEIMEFIDNGYSGTNFERPQVQKLIELVRANQIDCIIVKDFSRFGRNSIETGYFIERVFPLFHTRFISISDDFDSSKFKGDTGGMDVAFKYLISEYYSRDMSIKTKSAKYAKMQRGEYQSKICPYGYRKSADGRMEPDPEAAAVVQLIFQLAAEGINATAITRELFRRSIPTPGQYKAAHGNHTHDISRCHGIWSTSTILRILEDERYTGVYVIGKRAVLEVGGTRSHLKDRESWYIIPDHHPAIVEKAVFDTVQASQLRFSQPNKKKRDYPLKGKAFCGCCGHALSRTMQKTSYYYRHTAHILEMGETRFRKDYCKWAEKKGYRNCERMAALIFATAQNGIPVLPNAPSTQIVITEAIRVLHTVEASRDAILTQMQALAKTLPEYSLVREMPCIGDTLAPRLIAEIGDVRRFHSKRALIAYAGIDAPPYQSGKFCANNRHISKRGNRYLRKTGYEVMQSYVMHKPANDPIFTFIEKKRGEGKSGKLAMVAGLNKFLRVYYGKVTELYRSLPAIE